VLDRRDSQERLEIENQKLAKREAKYLATCTNKVRKNYLARKRKQEAYNKQFGLA